jgi:putative transposase
MLFLVFIRRVYTNHMERYAKNSGAIFTLKVHLVWCPKYRRSVLINGVDQRLKGILKEKAAEHGFTLHAMEVMPDHVHLFVEYDPTYCVAEIVNRLKGYSSRVLRQEFPWLRSRLPTLWSRRYFAGSVGSVTASAVQKYVAQQKGV